MTNEQKLLHERLRYIKIQRSRLNFWVYCKTLHPDFYKDDREYLKEYCNILQAFYEKKLLRKNREPYKKLIVRMPPRHGKTRTLISWESWIFGINRKTKIITCSYNDDGAHEFSKFVRDGISEPKNQAHDIVYSDIFPETQIKRGSAAVKTWALKGTHFSYRGAGIRGSITGKGGNIIIIDDPVKNEEEAFNDNHLEKIWKWYTGTLLSRKESGALQVICHTPWCAGDLGSKVLTQKGADEWYVFSKPARVENKMLCPEILSRKEYDENKRDMDELIFSANYDLEIIQSKFLLYKKFKTYVELPRDEAGDIVYYEKTMICDTADTGEDHLCAVFGYVINQYFYVTDIYFTQEDISVTEEEAARRLITYKINVSYIEANSAGHSWGYHVEKILADEYRWYGTSFLLFTQTKNKQARIFSRHSSVNKRIIFPHDWKTRWPNFYHAVMTYKKIGTNAHDDAPDTLTMIIEYMDDGGYSSQDFDHDLIPG
jgi:predicted phage terminase large subunit-like protein